MHMGGVNLATMGTLLGVEALFESADQLEIRSRWSAWIEARLAVAQRQVYALIPSLLARASRCHLVPQDRTDELACGLNRIQDERKRT